MIVAIDGPAGAGKTTVARELAKRLSVACLETGAVYRLLAWISLNKGDISPEETVTVAEQLMSQGNIKMAADVSGTVVMVEGRDISAELLAPEVASKASQISTHSAIREAANRMQRKLVADAGSAVVEGRDAGTVVFPDAELKIYLTADERVRASRRKKQLEEAGRPADFEQILSQIIARDRSDQGRDLAPLKKAPDAVVIDSTELSVQQVVERILEMVKALDMAPR